MDGIHSVHSAAKISLFDSSQTKTGADQPMSFGCSLECNSFLSGCLQVARSISTRSSHSFLSYSSNKITWHFCLIRISRSSLLLAMKLFPLHSPCACFLG